MARGGRGGKSGKKKAANETPGGDSPLPTPGTSGRRPVATGRRSLDMSASQGSDASPNSATEALLALSGRGRGAGSSSSSTAKKRKGRGKEEEEEDGGIGGGGSSDRKKRKKATDYCEEFQFVILTTSEL